MPTDKHTEKFAGPAFGKAPSPEDLPPPTIPPGCTVKKHTDSAAESKEKSRGKKKAPSAAGRPGRA